MLGRRAPLIAALAVLAAVGSQGCRVFDASLLDEDASVEAGPADAGTDAGSVDAGCVPRKPPTRPGGDNGDGEELLFALRDPLVDQRGENWRTIGYDLDDLCSEHPEPEVECLPPDDTASPEPDGRNGTDNSFGHNFSLLLLTLMTDLTDRFDTVQVTGRGTLLLRLLGWNGEDDDPQVEVILSHAVRVDPGAVPDGGMRDAGMADAGLPDGGPALPRWMGTDVFYGSTADFVGGDPGRPRIRNDNAYVAGRTLVVPLPERESLTWQGDGLNLTLRLIDPILTARISEDASMLQDVVIAGRWPTLDVIDAFYDLGFCAGTLNLDRLELLLNESADVRETPASGAPCNAISVGMGFTGYRGIWGGVVAPDAIPGPCD